MATDLAVGYGDRTPEQAGFGKEGTVGSIFGRDLSGKAFVGVPPGQVGMSNLWCGLAFDLVDVGWSQATRQPFNTILAGDFWADLRLLVAPGLVTLFACPPTKSGFPGHCLGSGAPEPRWQLFLFVRARVPVNGALGLALPPSPSRSLFGSRSLCRRESVNLGDRGDDGFVLACSHTGFHFQAACCKAAGCRKMLAVWFR